MGPILFLMALLHRVILIGSPSFVPVLYLPGGGEKERERECAKKRK